MKYKVLTDSLSGKGNKIFKAGDIVDGSRFPAESINRLIDQKFISQEGKKEPEVISGFVDSHNVEFGYELISALPYAYWLHQRGLLKGTRSGIDTAPLYWFSPDHQINPEPRHWDNMKKAWRDKIPNIHIHNADLDERFLPPTLTIDRDLMFMNSDGSLNQERANSMCEIANNDKPVICICNRINIEWGKEVINYFDIPTLEKLFIMLGKKYNLVYFNIAGKPEYYDGVDPVDIGDYELAKKYGVQTIHELHNSFNMGYGDYFGTQDLNLSFNDFQMRIMSISKGFITMNGGYSILASYFGGTNIIYSKECQEIKPEINSFFRWYHRFGNSTILHTDNYTDLLQKIHQRFMDEGPVINILIRTHNRPNFFRDCIESIQSQTYKKINIIAGYHSKAEYLVPYKIRQEKYPVYQHSIPAHPDRENYGAPFPPNHYLNHLISKVTEGFVILMDDDDAFQDNHSLQKIVNKIKSTNDMVMWRLRTKGRMIPSDSNFKKPPVARDISGITFCCHFSHLQDEKIEPYRLADFRLISNLYKKLKPKYINEPLTKMQADTCNFGRGNDKQHED